MENRTKKTLDRNEGKFQLLYGKTFSQRKYRTLKFMEQVPKGRLIRRSLYSQFVGMTLGGTVGGVIGLIGGPKGAAVGAGSGAGVGLLAGTACAGYQTRQEYKRWKKQYCSDEIFIEFLDLFESHPNLSEFKCPITKELMHYPFVDPWGFSYEKEAIEKWIKEHKSSPVSKFPLQISDLRPNYFLMGKQAKTYRDLLSQATSNIYLSSLQAQGIGCLLKDLEGQIKTCFSAENKALLELLESGLISRKAFIKQLTLLAEYLDCERYD